MKTNEAAELAICNFLLSKFIYYLKFLRRYCKISPNKETTLAQICEIEGRYRLWRKKFAQLVL